MQSALELLSRVIEWRKCCRRLRAVSPSVKIRRGLGVGSPSCGSAEALSYTRKKVILKGSLRNLSDGHKEGGRDACPGEV
ncbi:hypothetical protein [Mesobacillus zeae]|uniref:Uncharacterized protein n=1 Tax=Mesobacillus zeae TaxID=1917180 RepID=A0A398B5W4_9BACI|nr:hypothetical protein [Mesobacillus zeae]RID84941.1 hypothetical protein D1970_11415 [Mesobacillus zeae]